MNVAEVKTTIEEMRAHIAARENEDAHVIQDNLYVAVLRKIARAKGPDAQLARAAVKAADLDYDRWYA